MPSMAMALADHNFAPLRGAGDALVLQWSEQGGPQVRPPEREGYGTSVIRELLAFGFGGVVELTSAARAALATEQIGVITGVNSQSASYTLVIGDAGKVVFTESLRRTPVHERRP
jgi:hypothetical protein